MGLFMSRAVNSFFLSFFALSSFLRSVSLFDLRPFLRPDPRRAPTPRAGAVKDGRHRVGEACSAFEGHP
jgi:hypothetical protein